MLHLKNAPANRAMRGGGGSFAVIRVPLGLLLVVAAVLKAHGTSIETLLQFNANTATRLFALCEAALGMWLLSGRWPSASWLVAVATFAAFTAYNLFSLGFGHRSCGCFGAVELHPVVPLSLDVAVLAALFVGGRYTERDKCDSPFSQQSERFWVQFAQ